MKQVLTGAIKKYYWDEKRNSNGYVTGSAEAFYGDYESLNKEAGLEKVTFSTRVSFENDNEEYPGYMIDETPFIYLGDRHTVEEVERMTGIIGKYRNVRFVCLTKDFRFVPMEENALTLSEYIAMKKESERFSWSPTYASVVKLIREQEEKVGNPEESGLSERQAGIRAGQLIAYKRIIEGISELRKTDLEVSSVNKVPYGVAKRIAMQGIQASSRSSQFVRAHGGRMPGFGHRD